MPAELLSQRSVNLLLNRNNLALARAFGESFGILFAASLAGGSMGYDISSKAILPYLGWRIWNLQYKNLPQIGEYISFRRAVALQNIELPDGTRIDFGEAFGRLTAVNNLWRLSNLPMKERQAQLALDSARFMLRLSQKIEDQDSDVRDLKAFKAKSHLVAQNPKLFESFGFTVLPRKSLLIDRYLLRANQVVDGTVLGMNRFLSSRDLTSFIDEAKNVRKLSQVAWATPENIVANKKIIRVEYERAIRVIERLRVRSQKSS